jgi:hypothetical protein
MAAQALAILDRVHRGAVEKQFFSPLYLAIEMHHQLGGLDLLVCGPAVVAVISQAVAEPLTFGSRLLTSLPNPHAEIHRLLEEGVQVFVDRTDLRTFAGVDPDSRISIVDRAQVMSNLASYSTAFYL